MKTAAAVLYRTKDPEGKPLLKIGMLFDVTFSEKNPILVDLHETDPTTIWRCVLAVSKMVHVSKENIIAVVATIRGDREYDFVNALAMHPILELCFGQDNHTADRLRMDILAQDPLPVELDKIASALP